MAQGKTHETTFYVQLEPAWSRGTDEHGEHRLKAISAARLTKTRPGRPISGSVSVKLTLRVPDAVFLPLRPEAIVVIPESMVVANLPIEVEAVDPS